MTKPATTTTKRDSNNWIDRVWQGAAAFAFLAATYREILSHVSAPGYMGYALAGLGLAFLVYLLVMPQLRR